jgi:hypothetical protein
MQRDILVIAGATTRLGTVVAHGHSNVRGKFKKQIVRVFGVDSLEPKQ